MGGSHSAPSISGLSDADFNTVIRDTLQASARGVLMAKDARETVEVLALDLDRENDGTVTQHAFKRAVALLGLGADEDSKEGKDAFDNCIRAVFERLAGGLEFINVEHLRMIASEPELQAATKRRERIQKQLRARYRTSIGKSNIVPRSKVSKFNSQRFGARAWIKADCEWDKGLQEFRRNLSGASKVQSMTTREKHLDEWDVKADAWELRLELAETRRRNQYKGMFPPWMDGKRGSDQKHGSSQGESGQPQQDDKQEKERGLAVSSSKKTMDDSLKPSPPTRRQNCARRKFGGNKRRVGGAMRTKGQARVDHLESAQQDGTLEELQRLTSFTINDLETLRSKFLQEAERVSEGDSGELPCEEFCGFFTAEYPQLCSRGGLLERLFTLFDTDGNGGVSFQEFIIGMAKAAQCPVEEKMQLLFKFLDLTSEDGSINLGELADVIGQSQAELQKSMAYARDFFTYLDKDGDGVVDMDEFKEALGNNPKLFKSLRRVLPLPTSALGALTELQLSSAAMATETGQSGNRFSLESLKELYRQYSRDNKRSKHSGKRPEMSRKEFRATMGRHFGLTRLDHQRLLDALFNSFDADGNGSVSFEEVLQGLSLLINEQTSNDKNGEDCLEFYFGLLASRQEDGQWGISVDRELKKILAASEDKLQSDYRITQKLLGRISNEPVTTDAARRFSNHQPPEREQCFEDPAEHPKTERSVKEKRAQRRSISEDDFHELAQVYPELLHILKNNLR